MSDSVDAAARLETALERIAQALSRRPPPGPAAAEAVGGEAAVEDGRENSGPDVAEIAARLDSVIARLRAVLGVDAG